MAQHNSEVHRPSPYKGLVPYDEVDAPFFFGRSKETRLITANLFAAPLTLLYGPSGVGKTSVLRAGVAYQSRQRSDVLVVIFNTWGSDPVGSLKMTLADATEGAIGQSVSPVPPAFSSLAEYLVACAARLQRHLMIVLDQFEEYFLYHPQDESFAVEFPRAAAGVDAPISFLISIREDSLAQLDRFEGRIPNLFDNYLRIEHLDQDSAREAIVRPLEQYNRMQAQEPQQMGIESRLIDAVLTQVQAGQVGLGGVVRGAGLPSPTAVSRIEAPYLQLVMTRLWAEETRQGSRTLRLTTLQGLGGAEKIVRNHLTTVMGRLPRSHRELAARFFYYLVTPSGSKIAHTARDLAGYIHGSQQRVDSVLQRLSAADILLVRPFEVGARKGETFYEVYHDAIGPAIVDWRTQYIRGKRLRLASFIGASVFIFLIVGPVLLIALSLMSISISNTRNFMASAWFLPFSLFFCGDILFAPFVGLVLGLWLGSRWSRTS